MISLLRILFKRDCKGLIAKLLLLFLDHISSKWLTRLVNFLFLSLFRISFFFYFSYYSKAIYFYSDYFPSFIKIYYCCFMLVRRFYSSNDNKAYDYGLLTVDIEFLLFPYPNAIVLSPFILSIVYWAYLVKLVLIAGIDVPELTLGIYFFVYGKY